MKGKIINPAYGPISKFCKSLSFSKIPGGSRNSLPSETDFAHLDSVDTRQDMQNQSVKVDYDSFKPISQACSEG